jgi:hypothetical protein
MSVLFEEQVHAGGAAGVSRVAYPARRVRDPRVRRGPGRGTAAPASCAAPAASACVLPRERVRWPVLVLAAIGVLEVIVGFTAFAGGMAPPVPDRTTTVSVTPGVTLWELAVTYAPDSAPAEVIGRIEDLNGLSGGELVPGRSLTVPVQQGAPAS